MRIGVDLDDVLADCTWKLVDFYNESFGFSLKYHQITTFGPDFAGGETRDLYLDRINKFFLSPYFINLKPLPKARQSIKQLKNEKHSLRIITGRPESTQKITYQWLDQYFPGQFNDVCFAGRRLGNNEITKHEICKKYGIELMIEDAPEYVEECANSGAKVLLFDQPWNQRYLTKNNIFRVYNWAEIVGIIEKMTTNN